MDHERDTLTEWEWEGPLVLHSVNNIRDFDFVLSSYPLFNSHVDVIYSSKRLDMLVSIKCVCSDFNNPLYLNVLYCSLVISRLEYSARLYGTEIK